MASLVQQVVQGGPRDQAEAGKAGEKGRWLEHESRRDVPPRQMRKAVGRQRQAASVLRCRRPHHHH
jgi:hypothetical protein